MDVPVDPSVVIIRITREGHHKLEQLLCQAGGIHFIHEHDGAVIVFRGNHGSMLQQWPIVKSQIIALSVS